jgi:hypothetical protein
MLIIAPQRVCRLLGGSGRAKIARPTHPKLPVLLVPTWRRSFKATVQRDVLLLAA